MPINFGGFSFDPQTGAFTGGQGRQGRPRKPMGNRFVRVLISLIVTLIVGFLHYYFRLPALNIHDGELYWFVILLCVVFTVMMLLTGGFRGDGAEYVTQLKTKYKVSLVILGLLVAAVIIGGISGWVVLRSGAYSKLLPIQEGDFAQEVAEISFGEIPMLDSTSADVLANRKLGELSDLVSQFEVSGTSAQINLHNAPVRVMYLNYGDFFKWANNQQKGIPAYIVIDMVTQEVTVERLESGIKYSPSEYFFRNIDRYLRFCYPTFIFGDTNFEVDEDGQPYWVASVYTKTIGLFGGTDVVGAVLVNAVTGARVYYDVKDVPDWVDRVYSADLIMQQYDYYGMYHNGFINSLFGQRDCTVTSGGYNYIAQDDAVWIYTGITSMGGDESNVGFILANQRTKEARYYPCAGAEEYSAMDSAQGAVQQYKYQATFPLLLNISGQPTYFMALKDSSSLVKMYAMVNVQQYQIVATGFTAAECQASYLELMVENGIIGEETPPEQTVQYQTAAGTIADIRSAVINGNTWYYIRLEGGDVYYTVSAADDENAVILSVGDQVTITYAPGQGDILAAQSIE